MLNKAVNRSPKVLQLNIARVLYFCTLNTVLEFYNNLWGLRIMSRNTVAVPARQSIYAGRIDSLESIPGLPKSLNYRLCVRKRGNKGLGVYSMNKTLGRRKVFKTKLNSASRLSSCSVPSHPLLKLLLWGEIAL